MFGNFVTLAAPLIPFDLYLTNHGSNQVQDGVTLQSDDENFEYAIYDLLNYKSFRS